MLSRPPSGIAYTVEQWSPNFWAKFVQDFWEAHGYWAGDMRITSWWRDPAHNRRVGGHPDSQHLIGTALDVTPPDGRLADAFRRAGFIAIQGPRHVHVQAFPAGLARRSGLLSAVGV